MTEGRRSQIGVLLFLAVWFLGAQIVGFYVAVGVGLAAGVGFWFASARRGRSRSRR